MSTDAEAAEVLWASSEQGKAAVRAAWTRVRHIAGPYDTYEHQGPGGEISKAGGIQVQVDMADVSAIVYAAYLAAGWDAEQGEEDEDEPIGCGDHQWAILGAQEVTPPGFTLGKPAPHTAVLARCLECAKPESWLLIGTWTLEDLQAKVEVSP